MTDLVVISLEVWDEVWRRNQHLVAGLLRSGKVRRVLFVEPAVDALYEVRRGRRPQAHETGLRQIELTGMGTAQLWALRPRKWLPRKLDPRGDRRRARLVETMAGILGMRNPVLWVNDPAGVEVLRQTGWSAFYDITDDWLVADRPDAALARLRSQEAELFASCREVVVCSPALKRTKSSQRGVVLIPNAVDLKPYRTLQPRPPDLPPGLIVLYLGTIHRDRIDVSLCLETSRQLSQLGPEGGTVNLVLVGPAPLPTEDLDRLRAAGVHLLGPRPSHDVPSYLQHADVLLVPHVLTEFTASLDPIKAYEYRAAGRRVVATKVPGFVDSEDVNVQAVDAADFPGAVVQACRRAQPWTTDIPTDVPTWRDRVDQMNDVIERVYESRL